LIKSQNLFFRCWRANDSSRLTFAEVAMCVGIFLVGELSVSRLLYGLHVRDQPY